MANVSAKIENAILKQKIRQLTDLCKHHKSQYEQIKAKSQVQLNQATDEYILQITTLKQQKKNQKIKLILMQNKLKQSQQHITMKDIEHSQQITSLQHEIENVKNKLKHKKQNNVSQKEQIHYLQTELSQKDEYIVSLKEQLNSLSDEYKPNRSQLLSPSTLKMVKSVSIPHILPNETSIYSSPEMSRSALKATFFINNRNHDISPISSLSSSNHAQVHLKFKTNQYKERKNDINKWSDTIMQKSKPPPIDIPVVDVSVWKSPTDLDTYTDNEDIIPNKFRGILALQQKNSNSNSNSYGLPTMSPLPQMMKFTNNGITPQSQLSSSGQSSSAQLIKRSETQISEDVGTTEDAQY